MTGPSREQLEVEALRTDRYLEGLLAGLELASPAGGPLAQTRAEVAADGADPRASADRPDPIVRAAALRLQRDLQRVHPSFRFEERLAQRLADVAAALALPVAAGGEDQRGVLLPFPFRPSDDPATVDLDRDPAAPGLPRPVLIGGAVASAAISLAGAAYVAWRLGRPGDPMARAVRVAHHLRVAGPGGVD